MTDGNTAVVLIPGLLCDAMLFRHQTESLSASATPWVADCTRHRSIPAMARNLLTEVPFRRFALAGLSMGGYVALEVLRLAPERVTRLALLDTTARPDTQEQTRNRLRLINLARSGKFDAIADLLVPTLVHDSRIGDETIGATIRAMARGTGAKSFAHQELAIMARTDSRPSLRRIRCPTWVICGRQDAITPVDRHEELAAGIPGAVLEVIDKCGHLSSLEEPQQVSSLLRQWIDS